MSFLTPLAFIGGLIAIPIILLYMLRLRRREVLISSTFLWQQIIQDQEANTPWQRLRRNLLLFLQLLILLLLVITLARPFTTVPAVSTGQTALLLDASASMNATDVDGRSRFDEAKRRALQIVNTKGPDDDMTVIRVSDVPQILTPYTSDREALRDAINDAHPSLAKADWVAALTLAAAGGTGVEEFNVVVISDGGLGQASGLPAIPGEVRYVPIGESSNNLAITALATDALPGEVPQLFAQIHNYGSQDADVIFSLRVDGELFASERYTVPAQDDLPIISTALPDQFTTIQASLTMPVASDMTDYLAQDNNAYTVSSGVDNRRLLLLTPGNLFVEQVLRSLPALQAFKGDVNSPLPTQPFDLYVFDGWTPTTLPDGNLLFIDPPDSTSLFIVGDTTTDTGNIIVKRDDPRMTFVDFTNVSLLQFRTLTGINWADTLIRADGGPLLIAGEVDGRKVAVLTFDVRDSDLPLQITWPVLMANLLDWFAPRNAIAATNSLNVGDTLVVRPPFEADSVRITLPDDTQRTLDVGRDTTIFAETGQTGIYMLEILKDGEVIQSQPFTVNLFEAGESDITPQPTIDIAGKTIAETVREEFGQREYWPEVMLLALLLLLIEWIVYQRRMRVPTVLTPVMRRRRTG
jgi:Ca-activated chloride channel family protein